MEGLVYNDREHENPCFDTTSLKGHVITFWIIYKFVNLKKITSLKNHQKGSGAGWAKKWIPMEKILKFINIQSAKIKNIVGNKVFVTAGAWLGNLTKSSKYLITTNYYAYVWVAFTCLYGMLVVTTGCKFQSVINAVVEIG